MARVRGCVRSLLRLKGLQADGDLIELAFAEFSSSDTRCSSRLRDRGPCNSIGGPGYGVIGRGMLAGMLAAAE